MSAVFLRNYLELWWEIYILGQEKSSIVSRIYVSDSKREYKKVSCHCAGK